MLPHILPGPVHALLRRTAADILPPRSPTEVRSECISQKIESFLSGVPKARLLFVEGQPQPRQYTSRPLQCLFRLSATEDHEVVRVIDYPRPILFSTSGPLPSLQHPVPVEIGQQRADHSLNAKDNLRRKVFRMAPRAMSDHPQDRRSAVP